ISQKNFDLNGGWRTEWLRDLRQRPNPLPVAISLPEWGSHDTVPAGDDRIPRSARHDPQRRIVIDEFKSNWAIEFSSWGKARRRCRLRPNAYVNVVARIEREVVVIDGVVAT